MDFLGFRGHVRLSLCKLNRSTIWRPSERHSIHFLRVEGFLIYAALACSNSILKNNSAVRKTLRADTDIDQCIMYFPPTMSTRNRHWLVVMSYELEEIYDTDHPWAPNIAYLGEFVETAEDVVERSNELRRFQRRRQRCKVDNVGEQNAEEINVMQTMTNIWQVINIYEVYRESWYRLHRQLWLMWHFGSITKMRLHSHVTITFMECWLIVFNY